MGWWEVFCFSPNLCYLCAMDKKGHDMKKEQQTVMNYEAPKVEIIEVKVESGFATSSGNTEPIGDGETYDFF